MWTDGKYLGKAHTHFTSRRSGTPTLRPSACDYPIKGSLFPFFFIFSYFFSFPYYLSLTLPTFPTVYLKSTNKLNEEKKKKNKGKFTPRFTRPLSSREGGQTPIGITDSFGFTPLPCQQSCASQKHTKTRFPFEKRGGASSDWEQGRAEAALTHLDRVKKESRWPHTHTVSMCTEDRPSGSHRQENLGQMGTRHFKIHRTKSAVGLC